jgi:hypothetical protein
MLADLGTSALWCLAIPGGLAALYGLHRLGLWMERRGWIYYRHRSPRGGGSGGGFVALQEILEPPARHVFHITEQRRSIFEERVPGDGDPPPEGEGADPDPTRPS